MQNNGETPTEKKPVAATCPCIVCTMSAEEANIVLKLVRVARGLMFSYKMLKGLTVLAATFAGSYTAIIGAIKLFQG